MNTFFEPVRTMAGMDQLNKLLADKNRQELAMQAVAKAGAGDGTTAATAMVTGCIDTQKIHMAEAVGEQFPFKVIVTYDESKAREMCEDVRFFQTSAMYYPAKDFIFYSADIHGNQMVGERIRCVYELIQACRENRPLTIVTTIDALSDMVVPLKRYEEAMLPIKNGTILETESLAKQLVSIGYERKGMVDGQGQFAIRGGIIDIFSFVDEAPVRIELWDDEVDSIRYFDVESQRSIEKIQSYEIFPVTEYLFTEDEIEAGITHVKQEQAEQLEKFGISKKKRDQASIEACNHINRMVADMERTKDYSKFINTFASEVAGFASYFPVEDTLFVLDEPGRMKERMDLVEYEYAESMKNRLASGYVLPSQTKLMRGIVEIYKAISGVRKLLLTTMIYKPFGLNVDYSMNIDARSINSYNNSFEYLSDDLKKYKRTGYKTVLVCNSRTRAARIVEDLKALDTECYFSEDFSKEIFS